MRIIGGQFRGKRLFAVSGRRVRPTADRLRESIFNIIAAHVPDAVVLDLFAGTGAMGIEALSRGAGAAVFVENSREALAAITRNIHAVVLQQKAQILKWDITRNLNCIRRLPLRFGLVFMDPPYNQDMVRKGLHNLCRCDCLERDALVVVEHSILEPIPENLARLAVADERRYGKTLVTFLTSVV